MRETNEDAFGIDPQLGLMVVADGLGGHPAGEVASAFVVEALPRQLAMGRAAGLEDAQGPAQLLSQSLLIVAEQLRDMGCATPEQEGMGATVVAALVSDAALLVAHLGDSRAYRLRNGHLELLTRDHNLGNALRDCAWSTMGPRTSRNTTCCAVRRGWTSRCRRTSGVRPPAARPLSAVQRRPDKQCHAAGKSPKSCGPRRPASRSAARWCRGRTRPADTTISP